jgi:hypothetical protein
LTGRGVDDMDHELTAEMAIGGVLARLGRRETVRLRER